MMTACFGVMCPAHAQCARYHAINGFNRMEDRIGTCADGGKYPQFELREAVISEGDEE